MTVRIYLEFNRLPAIIGRVGQAADEIVGKTAFDIEARAKSNLQRMGSVDTGNLMNSIQARRVALASWVVATNVIYARIHEYGGHIRARNRPYLMFRTKDGRFVRTRQVYRPARPYMTPAGEALRPAFLQAFLSLESML